METVYFAVYGSGMFPYDMLRYERCWPHSEIEDSPGLAYDWDKGPRLVVLGVNVENKTAARRWHPTVGRWESFTWRVAREGGNVGPIITGASASEVREKARRALADRQWIQPS